jgi:hypothetical protein
MGNSRGRSRSCLIRPWATLPAPEILPVIAGEGTARQVWLPDWSVVSYCVMIGLVSNWPAHFSGFLDDTPFFPIQSLC